MAESVEEPAEKRLGRPPIFNSPEELQEKIDDYFANGIATRKVIVGKEVVEVPVPTITGLVLHCGFADRASFYDYEKRKAFSHTIKRARTFIEREYEMLLHSGNATGAIFALKNFNWTDKVVHEHEGDVFSGGTLKIEVINGKSDNGTQPEATASEGASE